MFELELAVAAANRSCAGFPSRSVPHIASEVLRAAPVVLSISAFEDAAYLRQLVENALRHTQNSLIVLHLNRRSSYPESPGSDANFDWLWQQSRVLMNCVRVAVAHSHGSILKAQAANVAWARHHGVNAEAVLVLQASNMWWVRDGMEHYVTRHQQSVPRIASQSQCRKFHRDPSRHAFQQCASVPPTARPGGEDTRCDTSPMGRLERMACGMPALDGIDFVVVTKHEGSFYPLRDAAEAFDAMGHMLAAPVVPAARRDRERADGHAQPLAQWKRRCCTETFEERRLELGSALEEVFLQTYVANGLGARSRDRSAPVAAEEAAEREEALGGGGRATAHGDVLSRIYTEISDGLVLERPSARDVAADASDGHLRFRVPWTELARDAESGDVVDSEEVEIVANCTWLRSQAAGGFALKTHELRTHRDLRRALDTCRFPPL